MISTFWSQHFLSATVRLCKFLTFILLFAQSAGAQSGQTCQTALQNLQAFANQVNYVAALEQQQGIFLRCQGNPACMNFLYQQLIIWYRLQEQAYYRYQITIWEDCARNSPRPRRRPDQDELGSIDPSELEDIEIDRIDATTRIRIPTTPRGFNPR